MSSFRNSCKKAWNKVTKKYSKQASQENHHSPVTFESEKPWLDLKFNDDARTMIMRPHELEKTMKGPSDQIDDNILNKVAGSMIGMALGDALGAHVEFRPRQYLVDNPVTDFQSGGTWSLEKGQFTDDTSMALCLANSLVIKRGFNPYDQLVRYKWWYEKGYMSSTGQCFDIGHATRYSIETFTRRQHRFAKKTKIPAETLDHLPYEQFSDNFNVYCSNSEAAGNGALMRLAPVPLFFFRIPRVAVEYAGLSGLFTHGARVAYDACRYYAALIVAALHGIDKKEFLDKQFYQKYQQWFGEEPLCDEIKTVAEGSYQKKGGYDDGIRGKGYIVLALEAALWAFWSDENSFEKGVLAAVNLGDDTDTTAAIYGQLAGAYYGYKKLPEHWTKDLYGKSFILNLSKWIVHEGSLWRPTDNSDQVMSILSSEVETGDMHSASKNKPTALKLSTEEERSKIRNEKTDLSWTSEYKDKSVMNSHERKGKYNANELAQRAKVPVNGNPTQHSSSSMEKNTDPNKPSSNSKSSTDLGASTSTSKEPSHKKKQNGKTNQ